MTKRGKVVTLTLLSIGIKYFVYLLVIASVSIGALYLLPASPFQYYYHLILTLESTLGIMDAVGIEFNNKELYCTYGFMFRVCAVR